MRGHRLPPPTSFLSSCLQQSHPPQIARAMLTVTFKNIWAGWKDAPLSTLGESQAAALGQAFNKSNTKFDFIYASDLLRAYATGQAVLDFHSSPKPPFKSDQRLREQHFGIAEGHRWVMETPSDMTYEEMYAQGIFPILRGRDAKFPEAESLNDLAHRADSAIADCVVPHLAAAATAEVHIAIASHGLCISELVAALLRLDPDSRRDISYAGLLNTAWTRATVSIRDGSLSGTTTTPPLNVTVTDVNNSDHLADLDVNVEEATSLDDEKAAARAFFGGKAVA
ncbi:histidine phosphatase superfamily [Favolaschia claudopus]|uniref:Histidine phosphatase superfamily n=1 Tax=Favolaschia claudopus TaxID=2862362 RepID=A0AAW0D117_9AGAR